MDCTCFFGCCQPGLSDTLFECVATELDKGQLDTAVAVWADSVEMHLLDHSCPGLPVKRYKGRCQRSEPRSVRLGPPRLKGGRPSDFSPSVYAGTVQVRQWTKQIRRLRCLQRACLAVNQGVVGKGCYMIGTNFGKRVCMLLGFLVLGFPAGFFRPSLSS